MSQTSQPVVTVEQQIKDLKAKVGYAEDPDRFRDFYYEKAVKLVESGNTDRQSGMTIFDQAVHSLDLRTVRYLLENQVQPSPNAQKWFLTGLREARFLDQEDLGIAGTIQDLMSW